MGKPDAKLRTKIEKWMAQGAVDDVFAALSGFEDLRHADQPPVSKRAIGQLAAQPDAVRALLLGLVAASPTVRGFARKHGRRLPADIG